MFSKLFKRKSQPTNEGTQLDGGSWVKTFKIELSNMEESPTYELKDTLTVGSEVGDIVVADPSISPRHCSFTLQDNVVSILDHGSVSGTLVNEKKIPNGRYVVLQDSDIILVGDLQLRVVSQAQKSKIEVKEEPLEEEIKTVVKTQTKSKPMLGKKDSKKDSKKDTKDKSSKKSASASSGDLATNAFIRVFSVIADLLIAYTLFILINPFDEYREFLSDIPNLVGELLGVDWKSFWEAIQQDLGSNASLVEDVVNIVKEANLGAVLVNFFLVRLVSTLLFGVSISEFAMGVRYHRNGAWARFGGVLRVIIGMLTWPFVIFDIPAIFSRRTVKEYMTFTHTYLASGFYAAVGIILYYPLLIVCVLVSPLFQGFDVPQVYDVNDALEQRIRTTEASGPVSTEGEAPVEAAPAPVVSEVRDQGEFMKLELSYDPSKVSFMPNFKFLGAGKKMTYRPELLVFDKELKRSLSFEVFKKFNFKELLYHGISVNYFLFDKFPEIYNFVYASEEANAAFKVKMNETTLRKFADEVVAFTKLSFGLSMENAADFMMDTTPLLKGPMDYKTSLVALLEYKDFDAVNFMKVGSTYFLKFSYLKQKPFDLIVPLIPQVEGTVYKIEYDKKEDYKTLADQFYKFTLDSSGWMPNQMAAVEGETMTSMQVIDFLSTLDLKAPKIPLTKAQAMYGYYFEKSAEVLKAEDEALYGLWKSSIESIYKIIEVVSEAAPAAAAPAEESPAPDTTETDAKAKLFQNFRDLKNAVDQKDRTYLGLENPQV